MEDKYINIYNKFNKKIHREYTNFFTKKLIYELIYKKNKNNIKLERKDKSYFESLLFNRIKYTNNPPYNGYKCIDELEKKTFINDAKNTINYIDDIVNIINDRCNYLEDNYNYKIKKYSSYFILNKLKFKRDARINFLYEYARNKLFKYNKNKNIAKKLIILLLLRYTGINIGGHHCSIPSNVYNYMYDELNIKGEGFSSPLNSKLIEKTDTIICSVFKDIDLYFKSIGPFTENTMLKYNNINWILNPPFLSSTIRMCIKSIINTLEKTESYMLIILIFSTSRIKYYENVKNKYLYGYINEKNIVINNKKINRKNNIQYFICDKNFSSNFDDITMLFYTNNNKININNKIITISELWSIKNTLDIQQSYFTNPIIIK